MTALPAHLEDSSATESLDAAEYLLEWMKHGAPSYGVPPHTYRVGTAVPDSAEIVRLARKIVRLSPVLSLFVKFPQDSNADFRYGAEVLETAFKQREWTLLPQPPSWQTAIERTIAESRWILEATGGETAERIERTTLERAWYVLRALAARALESRTILPEPVIAPNGEGSVDLFWDGEHRSLLVNVPRSHGEDVTFSMVRGTQLVDSGELASPDMVERAVEFLAANSPRSVAG